MGNEQVSTNQRAHDALQILVALSAKERHSRPFRPRMHALWQRICRSVRNDVKRYSHKALSILPFCSGKNLDTNGLVVIQFPSGPLLAKKEQLSQE